MSAAFDWTERALKQLNVIEVLNKDEPDTAGCLLVTVESAGPGLDSTPAMSSRNATTTVAVDFNSKGTLVWSTTIQR